ncbi:MAG: glycosyltransferase [Bacilli bacterium]|nr:glycosyltransferase [Bacilli bacterium]
MNEKPNLLFVTRTMEIGGTEKVVLQLCEALKDSCAKIIVCSTGGALLPRLEELGIRHITIPDISTSNPLRLLKIRKTLRRIVKEEQIDIIHTHHRMAAFLCKGLKAKKRINTIHNTFSDKKALTRFAFKGCQNVACGSAVYDCMTQEYGIPKDSICTITNSIDPRHVKEPLDYFEKNEKEGLLTFVFVGRLAEQKGVDVLLNAISLLGDKASTYRFYLYGSGPWEEQLKEQAKPLDNVFFMGPTNNPLNALENADCALLPSRWEGLPLGIIESMAVARPIIASDIGSNAEIVVDGENGLLFKTEDPVSLSEALLRVKEVDLSKLSKAAKKTYDESFSYEGFIAKYKALYFGE